MKSLYLIICFWNLALNEGHKHGAPNKSCHKMIPQHHHIKFDGRGASLKVNAIDENQVEITIETEPGKPFKGFILQGRSDDNQIIGKFLPAEEYKMMTCDGEYGNSITHKNSHHKSQIKAQWIAQEPVRNVTFKAVIVFHYKQAQKLQHLHNL